jgi:hypothetical protein
MRFRVVVPLSALAGYVGFYILGTLLDLGEVDTSQGFGQMLVWTAPAMWGVGVAVVTATRLDVVSSVVRGLFGALAAYAGGFLAVMTWVAIHGTGT